MTPCPPAIATILIKIIERGVLSIRQFGWQKNADRCAAEADHIHFLPDLLINFNPGALEYYWSCMRVLFIERAEGENIEGLKALWNSLEPHIEHANHLTVNA